MTCDTSYILLSENKISLNMFVVTNSSLFFYFSWNSSFSWIINGRHLMICYCRLQDSSMKHKTSKFSNFQIKNIMHNTIKSLPMAPEALPCDGKVGRAMGVLVCVGMIGPALISDSFCWIIFASWALSWPAVDNRSNSSRLAQFFLGPEPRFGNQTQTPIFLDSNYKTPAKYSSNTLIITKQVKVIKNLQEESDLNCCWRLEV